MLGTEGISRAVFRRVRDDLPGRLTILRQRLGIEVAALPVIQTVTPDEVDVLSIESYPAIFVVMPDTTGKIDNRQTDSAAEWDEYSYVYNVSLYVYVTGSTYKETSLRLKRYMLAVREMLLANKIIHPMDDDGNSANLLPESLQEKYSNVVPESGKLLTAGEFVFQVRSAERITTVAPGGPVEIETTLRATKDRDDELAPPQLVEQPDPDGDLPPWQQV